MRPSWYVLRQAETQEEEDFLKRCLAGETPTTHRKDWLEKNGFEKMSGGSDCWYLEVEGEPLCKAVESRWGGGYRTMSLQRQHMACPAILLPVPR